ncbi:plancitoxin-1-like isoform X2 [Ruditapes philippinarum]|uniref:plancitoxin-1-like isoform X2 n=1 Tax=Ruditapes philippinarum TaxID=129788 RepID=UPI00295B5EDE|nr:plancitoxin-1-like isoform X2 [Ruditapes philippinarum]
MADARKVITTGMLTVYFILGVIIIRCNVNCLQCLSQNNQPVDWYIAYKLPYSQKNVHHDSFFYMDAKSTEWIFSNKTMKENDQAISNTLDQIYKTSSENSGFNLPDILYLMYNDQPSTADKSRLRPNNILKGHTKGVIGFDREKGFWLIHSIPRFPPKRTRGYSLQDHTWGQTILCISMAADTNLDQIGVQLLYNYPHIYDQNLPQFFASKFPNIASAMKGKHVTGEKCKEVKLSSLNGVAFHSFAKSNYFNQDLYKDLLAQRFESSLLVQSWQSGGGGKMVSNCTGNYEVLNIENMAFPQPKILYKSTTDHSKWAVTKATSTHIWTCIGDINRMESQKKRGGGAVCFQNKRVWENFKTLIKSYQPC